MALTYLDLGLTKAARIKTQKPAYWRDASVAGLDNNTGCLLLKYSDQDETVLLNPETSNLRVRLEARDMRFQPWHFTYRLLQCLYDWATNMTGKKNCGGGGVTEEDLVMARSLDFYDEEGNITGSGKCISQISQ